MKTIALLSGGKDSVLAALVAIRDGHTPVVVANVEPCGAEGNDGATVNEVDSYMFQTVGHEVVEAMAACMQLPLRRSSVGKGQSIHLELQYPSDPDAKDEVEVLFQLLKSVTEEFPEVEGVTTGAILSKYQRHRVEAVCARLGLVSLAPLWEWEAVAVLNWASALRVDAVLVKTASAGLSPAELLGLSLEACRPVLEEAHRQYDTHMAGEGGEFETIVLNCPLFREECLEVLEVKKVIVDDNPYAPSGHAIFSVRRRRKTAEDKEKDALVLRALCDGTLVTGGSTAE